MVTRELRTPLNALLATMELLRHAPLRSNHRRLVVQMEKAGAALLELTGKGIVRSIVATAMRAPRACAWKRVGPAGRATGHHLLGRNRTRTCFAMLRCRHGGMLQKPALLADLKNLLDLWSSPGDETVPYSAPDIVPVLNDTFWRTLCADVAGR